MTGSARAAWPPLPVDAALADIGAALDRHDNVLLQAETGSGKTTRVPLALLDTDWLAGRKAIMLEPRRLAARSAADYMASLLGEKPGQTVGYRMRLDTRVGPATRLEVVTEGVLTRMLADDPALDDYGLVIFDEFHERNLDGDLGLALLLYNRDLLREPGSLKLLLMSATLHGAQLGRLLEPFNRGVAVPSLQVPGRSHPVSISWLGDPPDSRDLASHCARAVQAAVRDHPAANILVFLPGKAEIHALASALAGQVDDNVMIAPLYGDMELAAQRRAIVIPPPPRRKIVLATNVAETSLTIDGINVVIDSGYQRSPRFDPGTGMTRLRLLRISRASATQRAGRAGRTGPGTCLRLWSESGHAAMLEHTPPEILQADLAPLAQQLLTNGVGNAGELAWLDPPPPAPLAQALDLLHQLGAATETKPGQWRQTEHGRAMSALPLHPRLAHMVIRGKELGHGALACVLAALLPERDPLPGAGADLARRLQAFRGDRQPRDRATLGAWREQAGRLARLANIGKLPAEAEFDTGQAAALLALAYPDRVASRQGRDGAHFLLANGRGARFAEGEPLAVQHWVVCAELGGHAGKARDTIFRALALDPSAFDGPLAQMVEDIDTVYWDAAAERVRAERQRRVGAIVLARQPLNSPDPAAVSAVLLEQVRRRGLQLLPWNDASHQLVHRIEFLRSLPASASKAWPALPDCREHTLLDTLEQWLAPALGGISSLEQMRKLDLLQCLYDQLDWTQRKLLDEMAPLTVQVPSGFRVAIDYGHSPPVLAVKLQEMFGAAQTPAVAGGAVPVLLHLLSPAGRPLQVTQDLPAFWRGAYKDVRKDMKRRYPKHPWPENPATAIPTRFTTRKRPPD